MIRAFENNTLGVVLASVCGALLLLAIALVVLWALPAGVGTLEGEAEKADVSADIASLQSARPLEEYAVVSERPVFNESRRPAPVLADGDELDEEPVDEYVGAPDVELAGIVITPSLKMATLKSKDHQYSLVAFEGKPLEGDFGTWQVSRIEERMVTLASADGEEMQLELQVHDAVIREPPKPAGASDSREERDDEQPILADGGEEAGSEPMTRAEEIRQRIEERREQLRRAAEERDATQAENYRDAIQDMIQKSRERAQQQQAEEEG